MAAYRARQLATIRAAIAAARQAVRESDDGRAALAFARAYIAADGVQVPGNSDADGDRGRLARALLAEVKAGTRRVGNADLQRELDRVYREVGWVAAQTDDLVVGFHLQLPASAIDSPTAEALSHENHGLGPGVFRKADIVVLQPECDGAWFTPVTVHEVEG